MSELSPALGGPQVEDARQAVDAILNGRQYYELSHEERKAVTDAVKAKWNAFCAEYEALIDRYSVELDFGCGCCSHGHKIDGIEPGYGVGWSNV